MDTTLLDAAFQLVSHSLVAGDASPLAELQRQFPAADPHSPHAAIALAQRLEDVAVEMADLARDHPGTPLSEQTLAKRCPGFSSESYFWAINDGFTLTR